jgi:hypothetical protein
MRHATRAYGAIANQTANPRELEADLLLNAAARLQAIRDGWNGTQHNLMYQLMEIFRLVRRQLQLCLLLEIQPSMLT